MSWNQFPDRGADNWFWQWRHSCLAVGYRLDYKQRRILERASDGTPHPSEKKETLLAPFKFPTTSQCLIFLRFWLLTPFWSSFLLPIFFSLIDLRFILQWSHNHRLICVNAYVFYWSYVLNMFAGSGSPNQILYRRFATFIRVEHVLNKSRVLHVYKMSK